MELRAASGDNLIIINHCDSEKFLTNQDTLFQTRLVNLL